MSISTEVLAQAFAEAARKRIEAGEKVYVARMDDGRYIGRNVNMVKSRSSALRLISCPNPTDWTGPFPFHEYGHDHLEQEGKAEILARLTIIEVKAKRYGND